MFVCFFIFGKVSLKYSVLNMRFSLLPALQNSAHGIWMYMLLV